MKCPILEVHALSLDPADAKYWAAYNRIYARPRYSVPPAPTDAPYVDLAHVDEEDVPLIIQAISIAREQDLSSQVFIPQGTALFEYIAFVKPREGSEGGWSDRASSCELWHIGSVGSAIWSACLHLQGLRGVGTVRDARIYMPGLNQIVNLEVDGKELFISQDLTEAAK